MKKLFSFFFLLFLTIQISECSERFLDNETISQPTNGSLTNETNSSNTSIDNEIINIKPVIIQSELSESEKSDLKTWIDWKNDYIRYDDTFSTVPKIFAPEKDYYKNSILMNGLPLYIIGGIVLFFGLLFFFFRYILVAFTKKELRPLIVTRFTRLFYLGVAIVGLLLFFSGMIVSLTGSMDYNKSLKDTQSSLKNNGQSVEDKTVEFDTFSTQINEKKLLYKNESKTFVVEKYNFQKAIDQSKSMNSGAGKLSDYFDETNNLMQAFLWLFFVLGLLFGGLFIFAMIKSHARLSLILGLFYILLSGTAFIISGVFYSEVFKVADVCEQNGYIINQNYPPNGKGIFYYLNCFNPSDVKILYQESYFCNIDALLAFDFYKSYLIDNNNVDIAKNITKHNQIVDLYNQQTFKDNTNLNDWGFVMNNLDKSIRNLESLKSCEAVRKYSVNSESNMCAKGIPALYLGFVGILVEAIAFGLLMIAGIKLRDVLEKIRLDKESMINIRQAGGYN